jgi:hypothetical protein
MPDLIGLTGLDNLTIQYCYKLKTLPRGLGKVGAPKQLTLERLQRERVLFIGTQFSILYTFTTLQEMQDRIGLTALDRLTIQHCNKLKTLPRGLWQAGGSQAAHALRGCMRCRRCRI